MSGDRNQDFPREKDRRLSQPVSLVSLADKAISEREHLCFSVLSGIISAMKNLFRDFADHPIAIRNIGRVWLPLAILIVVCGILYDRSKLIEQLQTNEFGYAGDAIIAALGFIGAVLMALGNLLLTYLVAAFYELLLIAALLAAVAQTQLLWVIPFVLLVGYGLIMVAQKDNTLSEELHHSEKRCYRQLLNYPLAKSTPQSKTPYLLYPLSCVLLN